MLMLGLTARLRLRASARASRRMQREIGGSVAVPARPTRAAPSFYQLHGLSNLLLSATLVGALLLVFWESREDS